MIVLGVAAWQAAIQDLTVGILDTARPSGPSAVDIARYDTLTGAVRKAVSDFATPNAQNTRRLMISAGFDPRPLWSFVTRGGRGKPPVSWTPAMVDLRLDEWLRIRHAVAHGHESLPVVQALRSVRLRGASSEPALLADAE